MKKATFLLTTILAISLIALGQDDYPDYRSKREMFTRIMEKDIRADVASFAMGGLDESVGTTPLRTIPIAGYTDNSITFEGDDLKVTITSAPFNAAKHKLNFYDEEKKYLLKIDNKPYFGDYGKVPTSYVSSVTLITGRDTVRVPEAAVTDLCNPVLTFKEKGVVKSQSKVYLSNDGKKIYVYMLKPESGGSYEATWVFQNKQYFKRVVDFGFLK